MPPRSLLNRSLLKRAATENYVCPSCLFWNPVQAVRCDTKTRALTRNTYIRPFSTAPAQWLTKEQRPPSKRRQRSNHARRAYSNDLASSTAINAPSTVPPAYRELHQRLAALSEPAGSYIDLSRLQLALRSLESEDPIVRIAFLGLGQNGAQVARKLARALLADALGEEEAWEKDLLNHAGDGRALLLRYGGLEDVVPHNPLVLEKPIPSRFLEKHRLEILIAPLNPGRNQDRDSANTILVPALPIPTSAGGRVGFVRFPVHRTLLVGEGIEGAIRFGQMTFPRTFTDMIRAGISLQLDSAGQTAVDDIEDTVIKATSMNVDLANHGLDLFRQSNANGAIFSQEWQRSQVHVILEWILGSTTAAPDGLKRAVTDTIDTLLDSGKASITVIEQSSTLQAESATVPDLTRQTLQTEITNWASDAHRDLQLNLTAAFASAEWRRTAWWRLLWRIDDVTVSAASIIQQSYLHESEIALANLCGKIEATGLATREQLKEASDATGTAQSLMPESMRKEFATYEKHGDRRETVAQLMQLPTLLSRIKQESGLNAIIDPPWPQTINLSRQQMLHTIVPSMHRNAQKCLVTALTTTTGASALAVWFWIATSGIAVYEAGAIAALGLVWSLRRLQTRWGTERDAFPGAVRENGRAALAEVEAQLRKLVSERGTVKVKDEDLQQWQSAAQAIDKCERALKELRSLPQATADAM